MIHPALDCVYLASRGLLFVRPQMEPRANSLDPTVSFLSEGKRPPRRGKRMRENRSKRVKEEKERVSGWIKWKSGCGRVSNFEEGNGGTRVPGIVSNLGNARRIVPM